MSQECWHKNGEAAIGFHNPTKSSVNLQLKETPQLSVLIQVV